jgi:hypothetical protein
MSTNPYAPPTAIVADVLPEESATDPPFFAVSIPKFVIMCLCTFTVYEAYWFYRHWKRIDARDRVGVWPIVRGIFGPLFSYPLFVNIRDYTPQSGPISSPLNLHAAIVEDTGARVGWELPAVLLSVGCLVTNLLFRLPGMYAWLGFLTVACLVPVQVYANKMNAIASPAHNRNSRLTVWNWLIVVPGAIWLLLAVLGTYLESTGQL